MGKSFPLSLTKSGRCGKIIPAAGWLFSGTSIWKGATAVKKLSKPVKGIFFDLGWTLVYPPSGDWEFTQFAKELFHWDVYSSLPQERLKAARNTANDYFISRHKLSTLEEEYDQFSHYYTIFAENLPELGVTPEDIQAITKEKVYQSGNTYRLFDDTIQTLETLKGNYKLGIISDTWPSIVPVMDDLGLPPYFDTITYSFQVGCFKPDPRMFQDALSKMGLPPEECVFIDDTLKNLWGAQAAGIQPVLITAKPDAEECPEDMASISKISELLELLK